MIKKVEKKAAKVVRMLMEELGELTAEAVMEIIRPHFTKQAHSPWWMHRVYHRRLGEVWVKVYQRTLLPY